MKKENIHPELSERQYYPDCECDHCFVKFDTWKKRITEKYLGVMLSLKRMAINLIPQHFKPSKMGRCGNCICAIHHDGFAWKCAHPSRSQEELCHRIMLAWVDNMKLMTTLHPLVFEEEKFKKIAKNDPLANFWHAFAASEFHNPTKNLSINEREIMEVKLTHKQAFLHQLLGSE